MTTARARLLWLNGSMPFVIGLLILLARNAAGYNGIIYICLGILTMLFYGIANFVMLCITLKSEDNHSFLTLLYLAITLAYLGLFAWAFTGFRESMQHFHPTMSP